MDHFEPIPNVRFIGSVATIRVKGTEQTQVDLELAGKLQRKQAQCRKNFKHEDTTYSGDSLSRSPDLKNVEDDHYERDFKPVYGDIKDLIILCGQKSLKSIVRAYGTQSKYLKSKKRELVSIFMFLHFWIGMKAHGRSIRKTLESFTR